MGSRGPITNELRELMGGVEPRVDEDGVVTAKYVTPEAWGEFAHRCDAIDAVHACLERENAELRERLAVLDNADKNMHDGWVRLPVDADGETIHVGDVMENIVCPSVHREVTGVGVECFYGWDDGNGRYSQFDVSCYRHHHEPTVEDVLREMLDAWGELPAEETNEAIVAEYAAKLQLREDS